MFQKRKHERKAVNWPAQVSVGNVLMDGIVMDHSVGGLFFTPDVSVAEELIAGDRVLEELNLGEEVEVLVFNRLNRPVVRIGAVIRWSGLSHQHGCRGLGLENFAAINREAGRMAA